MDFVTKRPPAMVSEMRAVLATTVPRAAAALLLLAATVSGFAPTLPLGHGHSVVAVQRGLPAAPRTCARVPALRMKEDGDATKVRAFAPLPCRTMQ